MTIEIADAPTRRDDEFGVSILVKTKPFNPKATSKAVGVAWCGICFVINEYMRSHGYPDFDCMKRVQ